MPYGTGPIADHARSAVIYRPDFAPTLALAHDTAPSEVEPEPVEFARLVQHLEAGELRACLADACSGGRKPCPCPDACRLSQSAESMAHYRKTARIAKWIFGGAMLAAFVYFLAAVAR